MPPTTWKGTQTSGRNKEHELLEANEELMKAIDLADVAGVAVALEAADVAGPNNCYKRTPLSHALIRLEDAKDETRHEQLSQIVGLIKKKGGLTNEELSQQIIFHLRSATK